MIHRLLSLISIGVAAFLQIGCHSPTSSPLSQDVPLIPVVAEKPIVTDVTQYIESVGLLHPFTSIELSAKVAGQLEKIYVEEGQYVNEGSLLLDIDARPYLTKVKEAQAHYLRDEIDLAHLEAKGERLRQMRTKQIISQAEWEEWEAAKNKMKATIQLDAARLEAAELELSYCHLTAPTSGFIGKLSLCPGLWVTPGQQPPLLSIQNTEKLKVEFWLTEKEWASLSGRRPFFEIELLSQPNLKGEGELTFIDSHFDNKKGQILARGIIKNKASTFQAGQYVRVRLPIGSMSQALLIPQKAIRYQQEGPYVYVVTPEETIALRHLILGQTYQDKQLVVEGLDREEWVLLEGHLRVSVGSKVERKS